MLALGKFVINILFKNNLIKKIKSNFIVLLLAIKKFSVVGKSFCLIFNKTVYPLTDALKVTKMFFQFFGSYISIRITKERVLTNLMLGWNSQKFSGTIFGF